MRRELLIKSTFTHVLLLESVRSAGNVSISDQTNPRVVGAACSTRIKGGNSFKTGVSSIESTIILNDSTWLFPASSETVMRIWAEPDCSESKETRTSPWSRLTLTKSGCEFSNSTLNSAGSLRSSVHRVNKGTNIPPPSSESCWSPTSWQTGSSS